MGLAVIVAGTGLLVLDVGAPGPPPAETESTRSAPAKVHGGPSDAADSQDSPEPSPSKTPVLLRSVVEEVTSGSGDLQVVEGESERVGKGPAKRYAVEVEKGLPGRAADFAKAVETILADERSWRGTDTFSVQRVDSGPVDFRVALAAPDTVDARCAPLNTNGYSSCTRNDRAIINQNRWVSGVEHFDGDLETYRTYVINHEVGHALGRSHVTCPGPGETAPVMQQQTFGLDGCERNGWVHP